MTQVEEDTVPYQPKRGEKETTIPAAGCTKERVEAAEERRRQQQLHQSKGYNVKTAKYENDEQHG